MANIWARMASRIVKNATKNCLVLNVPTVIVILAEKCFRPVTIIIFIQLVHDAQNAGIHLVMVKRCICREAPVCEVLSMRITNTIFALHCEYTIRMR